MKHRFFDKVVCFLLSFFIILSMFNTQMAFGEGSGDKDISSQTAVPPTGYSETDYPAFGAQGHVKMTKSAQWVDKEKGIAEITFNIVGTPVKQGVDAILVIDRSGSMGGGSYKINSVCINPEHHSHCEETINWVNSGSVYSGGLLGSIEYQDKIGTCNQCGSQYNFTSERTWFFGWSSWSTPTPTKCAAGLDKEGRITTSACNFVNTRMDVAKQAAKNFINTMFALDDDGEKTDHRVGVISFSADASTNYALSKDVNNNKNSMFTKIDGLKADGGTNYNNALSAAISMLNSRDDKEKTRPAYIVFLTDGKPDPASYTGVTQASTLKNTNKATIYSIGLMMSSSDYGNLRNIASIPADKYFYPITDPSVLGQVYSTIANQIKIAGTQAKIEDIVGDDFKYVSATASTGESSVSVSGKKITWNLGDITRANSTLKIRIQLENLNARGIFDTNKNAATVKYKNFNEKDCTLSVSSPKIPIGPCLINVNYYLVDDEGFPLSKDGKTRITEWARREDLKNFNYLYNNSEHLSKNITYNVVADPFIFDEQGNKYEYLPLSAGKGGNPTAVQSPVPVSFSTDGETKNVYFGYKKVESVTVIFDKNHSDTSGWTDAIPSSKTVQKGLTVGSLPGNPTRAGYNFKGWNTKADGSGTAFTSSTNINSNITVHAQWERSAFNLKINFKQEGLAAVDGGKYDINKSVQSNAPINIETPSVNGWILTSLNVKKPIGFTPSIEKEDSKLKIKGTMPSQDVEIDAYYAIVKSKLLNNSMYANKNANPINEGSTLFNIVSGIDYTFGFSFLLGNKDLALSIDTSNNDISLDSFKLYEGGNEIPGAVSAAASGNTITLTLDKTKVDVNKSYIVTYRVRGNEGTSSTLTVTGDNMDYSGAVRTITIKTSKMPNIE